MKGHMFYAVVSFFGARRSPRLSALALSSPFAPFAPFALVASLAACGGDGGAVVADEALLGGATSIVDTTRDAFSRPAKNLSDEHRDRFFLGNAIFNRNWVTAPASSDNIDGLGPRFNAISCSGCHFKDGRGAPPAEGERPVALLFRLSIPGQDAHGGPLAEPSYGGQFAPAAIAGVPADGKMVIRYTEEEGRYESGESFSLRKPAYSVAELAYGPTHAQMMISPRVAPHMIGMGLLEAIPEADILARADASDRDGDGVRGRPNYVWDAKAGARVLGRFGWKANQPNIEQQSAGAFLGDMGITSSLFPEQNCTSAQLDCKAAPKGGAPEIDDNLLSAVVSYSRTLAVPARRDVAAPAVRRGAEFFASAGCGSCHVPQQKTGVHPLFPELSHQTIRPYTDLLVHDMGEGLADHRPDFEAGGRDWRTPPLWGIGLVATVNRHTSFLHDGRARGFAEAILWHGGEGERSKESFRRMPKADRDALITFLESL